MKKLPMVFKRSGFTFNQVHREGRYAVYEKRKANGSGSFELVVVRTRKERKAFGKVIEAGEYYPSSEEWGSFGWTDKDLSGSMARLDRMVAEK